MLYFRRIKFGIYHTLLILPQDFDMERVYQIGPVASYKPVLNTHLFYCLHGASENIIPDFAILGIKDIYIILIA